jgi:exo-1,4-beta-D-glucosaminidase
MSAQPLGLRDVGGAGRALLALAACAAVLAAFVWPAGIALADVQTVGLAGWRVQSSALAPQTGAEISQPSFSTSSWLPVTPDDAGAVGTEVAALVQNGRCPEVFFSTNMAHCFGFMSRIGPNTISQFSVPWWFRANFRADPSPDRHTELIVNGVVGQADVWLNGSVLATQETVQGDYTRYVFDVTKLLVPGINSLALETYPNDPTSMFTLDNVDWTQIPPDNNTGIQFPIQLHTSAALGISDAHVLQTDAPDLSTAALTLRADVTNHTDDPQSGLLTATVSPPSGGEVITLHETVELAPQSARTISLTPSDDARLQIERPQVWWPYEMGAQPLYRLTMSISQPDRPKDSESETFGIRTITTKLVGPSPMAPAGARQFAVNGRPFVFRAGGWAEDLFLRYSPASTADQIALIKDLGLNGIRTEGKEEPADFYRQMDRAGILVDSGFQCCDNWQREEGQPEYSEHELEVIHNSARTIGQRLRNHPSVLNYSWSDNTPTPGQETASLSGFQEADFQGPLIASAEYKETATLGPSGEKEGPYDWVPPSYWYDSSHFEAEDPTRTNVGGAWAFDSEASAGATVPTIDSIRRFMSSGEQAELWQSPDFNQYHLNYEAELPGPENEGYAFGTLHDLDQAISHRYGPWSGLAQYVQEAQVANYETQRAQFEAYINHSVAKPTPSTGVVYWQLNKGWPTLLWDLYNYEYDQAGSYFGAKEANAPLHASYTYDTGTVSVDNLSGAAASGLSLKSRVYASSGKLLDQQSVGPLSVAPQQVLSDVLAPKVPAETAPPTPARTYFVELLLERDGRVVDRNSYWLSTQSDVVDWPNTLGKPQATMTQFADLRALQSLPAPTLRLTAATHPERGPGGADTATDVTVTNTSRSSTVAFFLRADVRRGGGEHAAPGDNEVLPVFWSDNDVTLWPGESATLRASYRSSSLRHTSPVVSVAGWNAPPRNIAAP